MDYDSPSSSSGGTKNNLIKAQWKELRDLDVVPSLWDEVEDYLIVSVGMSYLDVLKENGNYTFIAPDGNLISLPETILSVAFSTLDRTVSVNTGQETNSLFSIGSLVAFQLEDGKIYYARNTGEFYTDSSGTEVVYIDTVTKNHKPSYAITCISDVVDNVIKNYYFPVLHSKAQFPTAHLNWFIFDNFNISKELSVFDYALDHAVRSNSGKGIQSQTNVELFSNNSVTPIRYTIGQGIIKTVKELYITDLIQEAIDGEATVMDVLHYLLFVNAHREIYAANAYCFEQLTNTELSMQLTRVNSMIARQGNINSSNMNEAAAAKQAASNFEESTIKMILDKLIEMNLGQDISNLTGLILNQLSDAEDIHNWIATNGSCALAGLTPYSRALGFRKLLQDDEYWSDALLMLESINENDQINVTAFINLLVDNSTVDWLSIALPQLSETWEADGEDYPKLRAIFDRFMGLCGGQGENPRFASTVYTKTLYNDVNPLLYTPTTLNYTAVSQPIFFAKSHSTKYFYDGINPAAPIGIKFQDGMDIFDIYYQNGMVHIVQNYEIWDASETMGYPGWSPPKTPFNIHYVLSPYENVNVKFLDNYAVELGFDGGEDVLVPAYYLLFFKASIANEKWHANFRNIWNGVAIVGGTLSFITAPLTAGGSLAMLGAIVSATDIHVQAVHNGASVAEQSAFRSWDELYCFTQLLTLAPTGYTLLQAASKPGAYSRAVVSFRSLGTKLNQLPSNIEASLVYLRNVWNGVVNGVGSWMSAFPKLASKTSTWSHLELVFEQSDDFVRILSKNGDEVAKVVKNGSDEVFEIADDFFRATPSNPATPITGMTVKANTGETIIGGGFFKNADGSIGFVEDVSSYGSTMVQNTIKNRGSLRGTINGIQATEDAHHLFPVQSLKENQWVKKGVEGGFEFNTGSVNGMGVEKFKKATNTGRHGPHPNLTKQIQDHMNWWAEQTVNGVKNKNLTPAQTAEYMRVVADDMKYTISTTTTKLNDLDLGLNHF